MFEPTFLKLYKIIKNDFKKYNIKLYIVPNGGS